MFKKKESGKLEFKHVWGVKLSKTGNYQIRYVVLCSDFVGIEEGSPVKFSYSSIPVKTANTTTKTWSRKTGVTIAKARFAANKTLEFTPEPGDRLSNKTLLSQELMMNRIVENNPGFKGYVWMKGPIRVTSHVTAEGHSLRARDEPVVTTVFCDNKTWGATSKQTTRRVN